MHKYISTFSDIPIKEKLLTVELKWEEIEMTIFGMIALVLSAGMEGLAIRTTSVALAGYKP